MHATNSLTPETLLQHEAFVLALARSLLRDEDAARDVAQETWLSALEGTPQAVDGRSWLARVTRNKALNRMRGERRRAEREGRVARRDEQPPAPSPQERLELQHQVVGAVLGLEEPYRGVVVAAYYEGLAPKQIAQSRGVAAGTVRSQLSRALDQLRERLDRAYGGDRRAWGVALVGFVRGARGPLGPGSAPHGGDGSAATSALPAASVVSMPIAACGLAAVALVAAAGWWWLRDGDETRDALAAAAPARAAESAPAPEPVATAAQARTVVAPEPPAVEPAPAQPERSAHLARLDELPAILERTRQIKRLVLERRLAVGERVLQRYAWLESVPDSGVAKLLDHRLFGFEVDLPWLDGGGAYFSLTEGVHDYQRRPHVGMKKGGELCSGFYDGHEGAVLDLGEMAFRQLALNPRAMPVGLTEEQTAAWDLMFRDEERTGDDRVRYGSAMRAVGFDDDADIEPGHTYLLRAFSPGEFDLIAALEVAEVGEGECTFAWRILDQRPVEEESPVRSPAVTSEDVPPPPEDLVALPEGALLDELESLRARAAALLLDDPAPDLAPDHRELLSRPDAGVTRLIEHLTPWTELPRVEGGGAYFSFATRDHDYQGDPDLSLAGGRLSTGFAGLDTGVVIDLGEMPLALAGHHEAAARLAALEFPHGAEQGVQRTRQSDLGQYPSPLAVEGHSYVVRAILPERHDHLVAFEILRKDDYGIVIAWRILESWPIAGR